MSRGAARRPSAFVEIRMRKQNYLSFAEACTYVRALNLMGYKDWSEFTRSSRFPSYLPKSPWSHYAKSGWEGMNDFLGTPDCRLGCMHKNRKKKFDSLGRRVGLGTRFLSYKEAKHVMVKFQLKTWAQWDEFRGTKKRPECIPSTPERFYKDKGWMGMKDFLSC